VWTMAVRCGQESTISVSNRLEDKTLRPLSLAGSP
jgi:hypothetical protein